MKYKVSVWDSLKSVKGFYFCVVTWETVCYCVLEVISRWAHESAEFGPGAAQDVWLRSEASARIYSGKDINLCRTNPWGSYRRFLCVWMCLCMCQHPQRKQLLLCGSQACLGVVVVVSEVLCLRFIWHIQTKGTFESSSICPSYHPHLTPTLHTPRAKWRIWHFRLNQKFKGPVS